MKKMKKLLSLMTVLAMVFALAVTANADTPMGKITVNNASKGVTYNLYKVFGATLNSNGSIAYTFEGSLPTELATVFEKVSGTDYVVRKTTTNDAGEIVNAHTDQEITAAVAEYVKTIKDNPTAHKVGEGGKLVFDVSYGYYAIDSDLTTDIVVTVDSTTPNAEVNDKANTGTPTFPENPKEANEESFDVGETATYTLKLNTVNWVKDGDAYKQVKSYTITDTVTATDVNGDVITDALGTRTITSVKILNGKTENNARADVVLTATDYSFDSNGNVTISWVDTNGDSLYNNGATIEITYTAEILKAGTIVNKLNASYIAGTETKDVPEDPQPEETVYSSNIVIDKYETDDADKKLAGAKFVLSKTEGESTTYYKDNNGKTSWVSEPEDATVFVTDSNGAATIVGLKDGTYNLIETEAPAGYNKLTTPVEVTVSAETGEHKVSYDSPVGNGRGLELPETGGIGTTIFTVTGSVLMVGAAILFITKKRSEDCAN